MTVDEALALEPGTKITYIPGGIECTFRGWSETAHDICSVEDDDEVVDVVHISDFTSDYSIGWN